MYWYTKYCVLGRPLKLPHQTYLSTIQVEGENIPTPPCQMAPHTYTPSYSANVCCPNVAYLEHINPTPPKQKKKRRKAISLYSSTSSSKREMCNVWICMFGFVTFCNFWLHNVWISDFLKCYVSEMEVFHHN